MFSGALDLTEVTVTGQKEMVTDRKTVDNFIKFPRISKRQQKSYTMISILTSPGIGVEMKFYNIMGYILIKIFSKKEHVSFGSFFVVLR